MYEANTYWNREFKELIDKDYYYVDKTLFISDVLKEKVALCTRPRRFGKTLNMSRRCPPRQAGIFPIRQADNAYLFDGLEISKIRKQCSIRINILLFLCH